MSLAVRLPISVLRWMMAPVMVLIANTSIYVLSAKAHELRPAIVAAEIEHSGAVELRVALNLEAQIAGIGPEHDNTATSGKSDVYDRLRLLSPTSLRKMFEPLEAIFIAGLDLSFDGAKATLTLDRVEIPPVGDTAAARLSTLVLRGSAPVGASTLDWSASNQFGDNVVRFTRAGEVKPFFAIFLSAGERSGPIRLDGAIQPALWANASKYAAIGFEHILPKGLDHILFIIGLFLLSPHIRPLLWQVTGFTLAHSATLALGIYGLVSAPAWIVEPLIAASIVFVAVENLFTDRLRRWRPFVIFAFGLLHGLGFAGVLSEFGLPRDQFVSGLVGFNIGVELGQLTVLAICFLSVGLWFRRRKWYRRAIAMPASLTIALIATVWVVERTAFS